MRALAGTVLNNRWWSALKRATCIEFIRFSKQLSIVQVNIERKLVKVLEEVLILGSVVRLALDRPLFPDTRDAEFKLKYIY